MDNMYPKYMSPAANMAPVANMAPMANPAPMVHHEMMMPNAEPQVNVYNVNYMKPPVAPVAVAPVCAVSPLVTSTAIILVLFILLVIISRPHVGKC